MAVGGCGGGGTSSLLSRWQVIDGEEGGLITVSLLADSGGAVGGIEGGGTSSVSSSFSFAVASSLFAAWSSSLVEPEF